MERWYRTSFKMGLAALFVTIFAFTGAGHALEVSLEPSVAQRTNGGKVRVHIYATNAIELISFGVTVTYDATRLNVLEASKFEDLNAGWVMDADGLPGTVPNDQYTTPIVDTETPGIVIMKGGRLTGNSTEGLGNNDNVLLGWIIFEVKADVTGNAEISIDLAEPAPYSNFVGISTNPPTVYDGDITPGTRATICIRSQSDAREGDINGNNTALYDDYSIFSAAWGSSFGDANYNPACDLDADGLILYSDYAIFSADFGLDVTPCP